MSTDLSRQLVVNGDDFGLTPGRECRNSRRAPARHSDERQPVRQRPRNRARHHDRAPDAHTRRWMSSRTRRRRSRAAVVAGANARAGWPFSADVAVLHCRRDSAADRSRRDRARARRPDRSIAQRGSRAHPSRLAQARPRISACLRDRREARAKSRNHARTCAVRAVADRIRRTPRRCLGSAAPGDWKSRARPVGAAAIAACSRATASTPRRRFSAARSPAISHGTISSRCSIACHPASAN